MSQSLKEKPQQMHAWFVFLSQKSDQMANHEIICHLMAIVDSSSTRNNILVTDVWLMFDFVF